MDPSRPTGPVEMPPDSLHAPYISTRFLLKTAKSRAENLSHAQRCTISNNLLKLYNLLEAEAEHVKYNHRVYVSKSCGTAACALGHAILHPEIFPDLQTKPSLFGGISPEESEVSSVFGPYSYGLIFNTYAYNIDPNNVTREMAMTRIAEYSDVVLGIKFKE